MEVVFLDKFVGTYHTNPNKGRRWTLYLPMRVTVNGKVIVIPAGFWTDFASIPKFLWPVINPYELGLAPVLHDFIYFVGYESQEFCDEAFLAGMVSEDIEPWKRNTAYRGVRIGGERTWDRYQKENAKYRLAAADEAASVQRLEVVSWDRVRERHALQEQQAA